jgi:hypothetical protein
MLLGRNLERVEGGGAYGSLKKGACAFGNLVLTCHPAVSLGATYLHRRPANSLVGRLATYMWLPR